MSDASVNADSAASHGCSITAGHAVPGDPAHLDILAAIGASALNWQSLPGVSSLLAEIVASAVRVLPGCDGAALVTITPLVGLVARASLGVAEELIDLENALGNGPNWDVSRQSLPLIVELPAETRWPQIAEQTVAVGIKSLSCHPLVVGKERWGSLLLLSRTPNAMTHSAVWTAMFAAQAAIAVNTCERFANMQERLLARAAIERAKGILMARESVSAELAFDILRRQSQDQNIKLRIVSENVCRSVLVLSEGNCNHSV